jgi:hypothetical protein
MGYEVHVVRTANWADAGTNPIRKEEVDAVLECDPELSWSEAYLDMSDDAGRVTRYFVIEWLGAPCFWWYRDQILCTNPSEEQIRKLLEIARVLKGWVVGDEGELYCAENGQVVSRRAPAASQKKPMHPAVRWFAISFFVTFLVGGMLIFVNNLIVKFLPEAFAEVFGGILLIVVVVLIIVGKCISAVKAVRKISTAVAPGPEPPTEDAE